MAGARLHEVLVEAALAEGFSGAAGIDLASVMSEGTGEFSRHLGRYDAWLADGRHGAMEYLVRGRDRRADPRVVFPGAESIFCVLLPYPVGPAGSTHPSGGVRYARYLQGPDYHQNLAERLERVMQIASAQETSLKWKVCVDTSAVLERSWAALAGLGWIGKNTMLIHPQHGSYSFIGTVLMDQKVGLGPRPLPDYCGSCDRCLRACPTQAFLQPRTLDSRRCISYLTLEKRGEWEMPVGDRAAVGSWVAGCDICQEVCPFNWKRVKNSTVEKVEINVTQRRDWAELLRETSEEYRARVAGSAMTRIKYPEFRRNLARALTNASPDLTSDRRQALLAAVRTAAAAEVNPSARAEWLNCAEALNRPKNPD